ncbi:MAG: nucleotide-binding universal stress UspA family protein [Haloarculaceae archaeon]|jgi:nucleotide-binding universal stress UspA family protein
MVRLLVGTDGPDVSEALVEYLADTVGEDDAVYIVNSQEGGNKSSADDINEGEDALEILEEGLSAAGAMETQQFVRGKAPVEDLLDIAEDWDADEYVIGIRKRSPVGKMVFGSTAQNLLLEADLPVRCVPMVSD